MPLPFKDAKGAKKAAPAKKTSAGRSPFGKVMDTLGGVSRYDSADHVDSAPEMNRRKQASQGPASKGPFTAQPKGSPASPGRTKEKLPLKGASGGRGAAVPRY